VKLFDGALIEGGEGQTANLRVLVCGQEGQDLHSLLGWNRQLAFGALVPDDTGRRAAAESVKKTCRNGSFLKV
jgi:hypothetical protein